mgnify:CR=1 FL=1
MAIADPAIDLAPRFSFPPRWISAAADADLGRHRAAARCSPARWRRTIRRSARLSAASARPPGRPAAAASICSAPIIWVVTSSRASIFGARVSVVVGITAVIVAGATGTLLGIVSGYLGGWVDQVIMRITDTWLALPALTFAIFLTAIVGPSEMNIVIILAAVYWTRYARVIRGEVLSLKEREFVRLAVVAGCSKWTIMRRHILPNVLNSAIVLGTLMLGVVIVTEAALSFLGVGVPPPKPAWGLMLADGKKGMMVGYWWLTVLPGVHASC